MSGVRAGTAGRLRTRRAAAPTVLRANARSCFRRTLLPTRRVNSRCFERRRHFATVITTDFDRTCD